MAVMLPDGRRIGAHLAMADGLLRAADRAAEIGASALQIFTDNPTAWRRRAEPNPEIGPFRERLSDADIAPLVVHASYLINLASPDPVYHERSIELLAAELDVAGEVGARLLNVHIGSHGGAGAETGIRQVVDAIARARALGSDGAGPTIALENSSGGGAGLGIDVDELGRIADALGAAGVPAERVAFCLDTAHAWGAGHDLSDPDVIDAFLDAFDGRIGLGRLALVHLNDSKLERGSRMDRHEHVGAGRIGERGMAHLLRHSDLREATYILETPGMDEGYDAINLARAIALARGEPLEPLPPGALALRGSRVRAAIPAEPRGSS